MVAVLALALAGCASPANPLSGRLDGGGSDAEFPIVTDGGLGDGATARCGDGVCSPGETCQSCPGDCTCNCPAGFGDCDGNLQNGCETNLNSVQNCGACGQACAQAGGSNPCVLVGTSYRCQPSCDATHADCDGKPDNGCESDLTAVASCGSCSLSCANPHGSASCQTSGASPTCQPTCDPGWSACGAPEAGCATQTDSDPDHCGGCTRACSSSHVATRTCSGGACTPSCAAPYSDCSHPTGSDDGCETNGTADPGENDNACGGQSFTVEENATTTLTTNRILPAGDTDTFSIYLHEGSHTCLPFTSQSYSAKFTLTPPAGTALTLTYAGSCNNTWTSIGNAICHNWSGTCGGDDSINFYVQVSGPGGANSCGYYTLTIQYASEGNKAPGC
jgi:hypothetical protein